MATEIIRQGSATRDRSRPVRSSRVLERLRAIGAKGMTMANAAHRELAMDLAGGDGGDSAGIDGKRVRAPVWLFVAVILGAVEVGRLETEISHLVRDRDNDKAAVTLARREDKDGFKDALTSALVEQRRSVDQDLLNLHRELGDEKERQQALRELLIRKRVL